MPDLPLVRWRDAALGVALAALLAGPALARGELVGSPRAETYGHAWVQACAAERWPAWPTGTDLALGTANRPVIDPLPTWIAGGLARGVGLTGAWNVLVVGWIVLAAVGGAALGRALGLPAGWVAFALVLSPTWRGSLWSGLSEDGAVGLGALAIALLWSGSDPARGSWRRAVAGGLALGALAWCGLYLAWLGAAAAVGLTSVRAARTGRALALGRLLAAGVLALAVAAPAVSPFRARLAGVGHRFGNAAALSEPLWRVNPWRAGDLASFAGPRQADATGRMTTGEVDLRDAFVREHPTWIGYPTLALAIAGAGPAALPVAAIALWAVGPSPSFEGTPLGVTNPVAVALDRLPFAASFNHHARLWILGEIGVVLLAAHGLLRLARAFPRAAPALGPVAALLLLADARWLAPGPLSLPGTPDTTPSIYAALGSFPPGPVTVLGANGPGIHPQRVYFDQRAHGRRLLSNPDRPEPVSIDHLQPGALVVGLGPPDSPVILQAIARLGPPAAADASGAIWRAP